VPHGLAEWGIVHVFIGRFHWPDVACASLVYVHAVLVNVLACQAVASGHLLASLSMMLACMCVHASVSVCACLCVRVCLRVWIAHCLEYDLCRSLRRSSRCRRWQSCCEWSFLLKSVVSPFQGRY